MEMIIIIMVIAGTIMLGGYALEQGKKISDEFNKNDDGNKNI